MYIRTVKIPATKGSEYEYYEYLRLVESYRDRGKVRQRVVANLGRKELLAPHLESLIRLLQDESGGDSFVRSDQVSPKEASCWGPVLVGWQLWQELGLAQILDRLEGKSKKATSLSERAFVLVANRLCQPGSEHALAGWLENYYVCDGLGNRWLPQWEQKGRVQVNLSWLQRWYRTLDELVGHKEEVERQLYLRLRDLFSLQVEMVFYDLTSTYFEGEGPSSLSRHGYSRDGKPRNRQILVGMVMVNGWPIAHHVFAGNQRDAGTVESVVKDLEERFGLKRVVFVGDRGMVTTDNVNWLREGGHGYLVGLHRRRREEIYRLIEKAEEGSWVECGGEVKEGGRSWVSEVEGNQEGVRVFVVHSKERVEYERGMREAAMEKVRLDLDKLKKRVSDGKLKAPEKIGAAAARVLSRHHGHRYYGWKLERREFVYFEHPNLEREKAYEGKYLVQTEERELSAQEAVAAYKELSEVERAFRSLKDVIDLRPIYHRNEERVRGHVFVAALAFLLQRALEKKLKASGLSLSAEKALEALKTIHVVDIKVGSEHKRGVTTGRRRARQVVHALGISNLEPGWGS